jgi:hypothetical protein
MGGIKNRKHEGEYRMGCEKPRKTTDNRVTEGNVLGLAARTEPFPRPVRPPYINKKCETETCGPFYNECITNPKNRSAQGTKRNKTVLPAPILERCIEKPMKCEQMILERVD